MEIKAGAIGRLTTKEKNGYRQPFKNELVIMLESGMNSNRTYFSFFSPGKGSADFNEEDIVDFKRTKIPAKAREALNNYFKEYMNYQKAIATIEELEKSGRNTRKKMDNFARVALDEMDIISEKKLIQELGHSLNIYMNEDHSSHIIHMRVESYIEKYARPSSYGFIWEEYDGTYCIGNVKQALKEVGINVPEPLIDHLKTKYKELKYIGFDRDVGLGDKNFLISSVCFKFKINKNKTWSEVTPDLHSAAKRLRDYRDTLPQW